jgi:hypothetical protein
MCKSGTHANFNTVYSDQINININTAPEFGQNSIDGDPTLGDDVFADPT